MSRSSRRARESRTVLRADRSGLAFGKPRRPAEGDVLLTYASRLEPAVENPTVLRSRNASADVVRSMCTRLLMA